MKDHRSLIRPRGGNGRSGGSPVPPLDGALSPREQRAIERAEVEKRLRADSRTPLNEARDVLAARREELAQAIQDLAVAREELLGERDGVQPAGDPPHRDRDPEYESQIQPVSPDQLALP